MIHKKINDNELGEYGKDFMKIKFNTDDDIPLNKQLDFFKTVSIRNIFEKNDVKFYPQIFLDDCLYQV